MYSFLSRKGQGLAVGLGVLLTAIYLISVFTGLSSAGYSTSDDLNQIMKNNPDQTFDFFNPGLALTMALVVICVVVALLFGVFQMLSNPKNSLKAIIGVGAIVAVFFALYSTSSADTESGNILLPTLQKFDVGENASKLISGGLKTTLILAGLSAASMVLLEIYNIFK